MESLYTYIVFALLILIIGVPYWIKSAKKQKLAQQSLDKNKKAGLDEPATLHPRIDLISCIGCASCVRACPEDVLEIVDGRAAVVNGIRCVGHALCAEVCPVGAITMGFGKPKQGMEIPLYDGNFMTNIERLYIVGELGGVGLIKNAFEQSKKAVEHIASKPYTKGEAMFDVAIIGAGPAGIGAALTAQSRGLSHVVLEQYELGGSILHYPRQKLVLTSPAELPLYGKLKVSEISKEELLEIFNSVVDKFKLKIQPNQKVESITNTGKYFQIQTGQATYTAAHVVLALGRRGSPRKLNVPGENHTKVYYRLIEAEQYNGKHVLVVGGGDSAIEAAVGLARQKGNTVTLSYRREGFVRLKEKNEKRVQEMMKGNKLKAIFNSDVAEIRSDSVIIKEKEKIIHTIPNQFVFIFAGGELPAEFLKKIGIKLRTEDVEIKAA